MKILGVAVLVGLILCGLALEQRSNPNRAMGPAQPAPLSGDGEIHESTSTKQETAELQPQDFNARCHTPGVVVCQGFDSPLINIAARWPAPGLYPGGDNMIHGKFDREEKASGEGSLRFEILGHTGQNAAGFWRQPFGRDFGPGATFYVQFRERFSPEMLKNDCGDTTWKQVIF